MTSQIVKRSAAPSQGLWSAVWKDWVAGAVLVVGWVALWTTFTAGILAPHHHSRSEDARAAEHLELTFAGDSPRWGPAH